MTTTEPTPVKCALTLSAPDAAINPSGGSEQIVLTTTPECAWTASTDASWVARIEKLRLLRNHIFIYNTILLAVPEGYLQVKVTTKSGETVTGVRVDEDSFSLQIRDSSGRPLQPRP